MRGNIPWHITRDRRVLWVCVGKQACRDVQQYGLICMSSIGGHNPEKHKTPFYCTLPPVFWRNYHMTLQENTIYHNNTGQACYVVEAIPDSFKRLTYTARWLCGFDILGEKGELMGYQRADTRLHTEHLQPQWGVVRECKSERSFIIVISVLFALSYHILPRYIENQ